MRTAVIVLGDLGRSPRMQYHAGSLAEAGHDVDLVGLEGAMPMPAIVNHPRITCHRLSDRAFQGRASGGMKRFVAGSVARAVGQAWRLFTLLMRLPKADAILVQNPPAVPTLAVAWAVCRMRGSRFVIDWHNLSHTIVAIRLGETHRAVKALSRSERRWSRRAQAHLTVSQGLADWLLRHYGVKATVVYDRPREVFTEPQPRVAEALWAKLAAELSLANERIPLVVCPTSWTPDEDFDLLLEALERAERQLSPVTPSLVVILTGKGALRAAFDARAARRSFKAIAVRTHWLEPADYPVLIGMADLGLCLHQSSSGLDLPMKLADFRGAGIPVAAFDYSPVLGEALTSGHEGVTFRDPGGLAALLVTTARRTLAPDSPLGRARGWLSEHPAQRWDEQWRRAAEPVLRGETH